MSAEMPDPAFCSFCGSNMTYSTGKNGYYFACPECRYNCLSGANQEEAVQFRDAFFAQVAKHRNSAVILSSTPESIILLTGESGVGKTTIAKTLTQCGHPGIIIDGDDLRFGLNADLDFTDAAIMENMRRIGHLAVWLRKRIGYKEPIYISCIAPLRKGRELLHRICGASLREFRIKYDQRGIDDVKGLYRANTTMRAYEEHSGFLGVPVIVRTANQSALDTAKEVADTLNWELSPPK